MKEYELYDVYDKDWIKANNLPLHMKGCHAQYVIEMKYPVSHGWGWHKKEAAEYLASWLNEHISWMNPNPYVNIPQEVYNKMHEIHSGVKQ